MKFFHSRPSKPPRIVEKKLLALYDDPAFSADPLSHPYNYVTSHETELGGPPGPGHPTLKGRRRQRPSIITNDNSPSDSDSELQPLQPPNSPTYPDLNSDPQSFPFPINHTFLSPNILLQPQPHSSAVPMTQERKAPKNRISLLIRRKTDKQVTGEIKQQASRGYADINPSSRTFEARVGLLRQKSAPEPRQLGRPDLAIRSLTADVTASDALPQAPKQPTHDLDRIDELDESNLFGVALHHGGPYEAVRTVLGGSPQMPLGYINNGRLHDYHKRTMQAVGHVYMPPVAPNGVPLNLSPGQILPRNFRRQQAKPPRLRNNFVSPLPTELRPPESIEEHVTPPRHADFNQTPSHKKAQSRKTNHRHGSIPDNPLDGPPIDPFVYIGLSMLNIDAPQPTLFQTVSPEHFAPEEEEEGEEFNPYDPIHLESTRSPDISPHNQSTISISPTSDLSPRVDQTPTRHESNLDESIERDDEYLDETKSPPDYRSEKRDDATQLSRSSSSSPVLKASGQERDPGSEETLVQNEERDLAIAKPATVEEVVLDKSGAIGVEMENEVLVQTPVVDDDLMPNSNEDMGKPLPESTPLELPQKTSNSQSVADTTSISDSISRGVDMTAFDKQLSPYPILNDHPSDYFVMQGQSEEQHVMPQPQSPMQVSQRESGKPIIQKLLQRCGTQTTTRSSGSNRSYSSTKGDDGHSGGSPVLNSLQPLQGFPSPLIPYPYPPQFSHSRSTPHTPGSGGQFDLNNNRNVIPHTQAANSSSVGGGVVQRTLHRGNSNASSQRSSQLSPIEEDTDRPAPYSRARGPLNRDATSFQFRIQEQVAGYGPQYVTQRTNSSQRTEVGQIYHSNIGMNPGYRDERSLQKSESQVTPPQYSQTSSYVMQQQGPAPQLPFEPLKTSPPIDKSKVYEVEHYPDSFDNRSHGTQQQQVEERPLRVVNMLSDIHMVDNGIRTHNETQIDRRLYEGNRTQVNSKPQGTPSPSREFILGNQRPQNASLHSHVTERNMRPQPHYLPKKLVMPTPLQSQTPLPTSRHPQPIVYPLRPSEYYQYASSSTLQARNVARQPSPPNVLPPILSQQQGSKMDLAGPAARKLKKRASLVPPLPPTKLNELPPKAPLSFSPVVILTSVPTEKPAPRPKPSSEKTAKRVLSKKRTNL